MQESNVICALDVHLFILCHDGMKVSDDFGRKKKRREREREKRERERDGMKEGERERR